MKTYKYLTGGLIAVSLFMTSCVNDLNLEPIDPNVLVSSAIADRPGAAIQSLAKCYASFVQPGQNGGNDGDVDIAGINGGFGVYTRSLFNMQELTTDEVVCAWGDENIKDLHYQTWSPSLVYIGAMYSRIIYTVSICNEFIRNTAGNSDPETIKMNSEARFLRALAYYHAIDMFGNPAFITEADKPGKFFPKQTSRAALFAYVEGELKSIETSLGEPRFEYGRADKAAAWMLLARLYLNANVYVGTDRNADCIAYSNKVIDAGYILEDNYRLNFSADNDKSKEIIFSFNNDGKYSTTYGAVSFIIHSSVGPGMSAAEAGIGGGWGGNRTTKDFMNILVDTIANAIVKSYPAAKPKPIVGDTYFSVVKDKRVWLQQLVKWDITNTSSFTDGFGVRKFTNVKSDGTPADNYNSDFSSTDWPVFRLADAYLTRAEATLRSNGDRAAALSDVNIVRARAYKGTGVSGDITDSQLTLPFLLDERGRELYWECTRRTDLIRFGQFTDGTYKWQWKGFAQTGQAVDASRNLFPIPAAEVVANTNIKQNAGY